MRLLMTGCEYTGVTTLTMAIKGWAEVAMGGEIEDGHDRFKGPHLAHGELTAEEQDLVLALSPHFQPVAAGYASRPVRSVGVLNRWPPDVVM